ncbi:hypothetical protein ACMDCT_12715 [Halomonadaceae bacterium KBTZ08]
MKWAELLDIGGSALTVLAAVAVLRRLLDTFDRERERSFQNKLHKREKDFQRERERNGNSGGRE